MSGDGVSHSATYATGQWVLNPNHLLMEPLGAWWQNTLGALGFTRPGIDLQKLLSAYSGAIALGIFRGGIASRVGAGRLEANLGTLYLAFMVGFLEAWTSDEVFLPQLVFLCAAAALGLRYMERPSIGRLMAVAAFLSLAVLYFMSNALIALAIAAGLVMWHWSNGERAGAVRSTAVLLISVGVITTVPVLAAWQLSDSNVGLFDWLLRHGGTAELARGRSDFLQGMSLSRLVEGAAGSIYGAARSVAPVTPAVTQLRQGGGLGLDNIVRLAALASAGIVFLMAGLSALQRRGQRDCRTTLTAGAAWLVAVLVFGAYWHNTDTQFYLQLLIPLAALVSSFSLRQPGRRALVLALSVVLLGVNLRQGVQKVRYPRADRIAALSEAISGARAIVYPGNDEVGMLLYFVDRDQRVTRLSLMDIAGGHAPPGGWDVLEDGIRAGMEDDGNVVVVDIFDADPYQHPWKALEEYGYPRDELLSVLQGMPIEQQSRQVGTFDVRRIR
jgi:hypothetical protein